MKVEIFNVEHGQCAVATCSISGKKLMIDAGHSAGKWWPFSHFFNHLIENLIITNFDEDHVSDLVNVLRFCNVKSISLNPTITSNLLRGMKISGMGKGIQCLHDYLAQREFGTAPIHNMHYSPIGTQQYSIGHLSIRQFWINYPIFTDTNNLSLVSFVSYGDFTILFPGDLEIQGWKKLLEYEYFKQYVRKTNILIAPHHGRNSCEELFTTTNWKPQTVIISDTKKKYATQETTSWYSNRTLGCETRTGEKRNVFTTRSDGKITIDINTGNWQIESSNSLRKSQGALASPSSWNHRRGGLAIQEDYNSRNLQRGLASLGQQYCPSPLNSFGSYFRSY